MTTTRQRTWAAAGVAALLVGGLPALSLAGSAAPCTTPMDGGSWATYGQDLRGHQRQTAEHGIGTGNVASLQQAWITADTGYQSPPPIVSGGCVFINTGGHIEALSLRTGSLVWQSSGADTTGTFAVTVADGRVHVGLDNGGHPKAAAFDVRNGHLLWVSKEIYFGHPTTQESSAIVADGLQVLFTTGPDNDPDAMEGYGILDAATGRVLYKRTTIPPAQLAKGYRGGGVWGTPTVDL